MPALTPNNHLRHGACVRIAAILAALLAISASPAHGATQYAAGPFTWDDGTTANWGAVSGGPYDTVWTSGNDAVFEGTAGTVTVASATAHNLTFDTTGFALSSGTLTLTGTAPTIATGADISATIGSQISGTSGLAKHGPGTLVLAGTNNTFSGATTVNGGTLLLAGSLASPVTVNDGGTLVVPGTGSVATISVASGGRFDTDGGTYQLGSGRTLAAGRTSGVGTDVSGNLATGAGGVLQVGATAGTPATLNVFGNLALNGGTVKFDLSPDPASGNDTIHLTGTLDLSGPTVLTISPTAYILGPGVYPLIHADGGISGTLANVNAEGMFLGGQQTITLSTTTIPNTLTLDVSGSVLPVAIAANTTISPSDTSYENKDLVVSNATLTIQGNHSFGLIHLENGAVLSAEGGSLTVSGLLCNAGTVWLRNGTPLTVTTNIILADNSVLWCEGADRDGMVDGQWAGVGVTIEAANITVDATSRISADGLGYLGGGNNQPGRGIGGGQTDQRGGGYGGIGGCSQWGPGGVGGCVYGQVALPTDLGSGGAGVWQDEPHPPGGSGGGAISLRVGATLRLEGLISANGESSTTGRTGGGSGGGILIRTQELTGSGSISAKGGGGGGGGGRIAAFFQASSFTGMSYCSVRGGPGSSTGQPGTCGFFDTSVSNQHLHVVENFRIEAGQTQAYGALTMEDGATLRVEDTGVLTVGAFAFVPGGTFTLQGGVDLVLNNATTLVGATIHLEEGASLAMPNTEVLENCALTVNGSHLDVDHALTLRNTTFRLDGDSVFEVPGTFTITDGSQFTLVGGCTLGLTNQNLVVSNNSVLWCEGKNRSGMVNGRWAGMGVIIEAANITVDATSKISADGLGYQGGLNTTGNGPGGGVLHGNGGGAGHGGKGGASNYTGASGGPTYDSATLPLELGSGGGGGNSYSYINGGDGGGAIRLVVAGALNVDGIVSANGGAIPYAGGGSGGSILVETYNLLGNGGFSARGGGGGGWNGGNGGGGGGRVAVYYQSSSCTGIPNCSVAGGAFGGPAGYGGENGQPGTCGFFDTSIWGNHLHIYSRFAFEVGDTDRPALITVEPGGELALANGETWSLIDRLTMAPGSTFAVDRGSHLTTAGLARLENLNLAVRNGGVLDVVGDVTLGTGAHIAVSTGSTAQVSGLLHVGTDGVLDFQTGSSISITGGLLLEGSANMTFGGNVFCGETGYINMATGTRCAVKGNFTGSTRNSYNFAPSGSIIFNGAGTLTDPQLLEVMSADRGTAAPNFTRNFAFGAIEVTNGTCVKLVNQYANVPGATNEALYAQSLVVAAGSTLDLAGFQVYVRQAQLAGTVLNGTVTQIPDSGPIARNTGTPGSISLPGELDEWTFYGKTGETLTVAVNTGPLWPFAALAPQLGYAEVLVVGPTGQVIRTATSTAANQHVTITGLTLPTDGQYRVRVHAPPDHSGVVGNYTVAIWDTFTRTFPVFLNQQQAGTLPTPYSEDRWTFFASANQQIRLTQLSSWFTFSWAGVLRFDLLGPEGWTGFSISGLDTQSELITLPSSGTYTLVVRGVGGTGSVRYSFKIEQTTVIDLPPGTSFSGPLKTMLFKIHLDHSSPLRVSVRALLPSWAGSSLRLQFGQPPTRSRFDRYVFYSCVAVEWTGPNRPVSPPTPPPTQYSDQIVIPMAAAGDWYALVDSDASALFTISAAAGDVLIENISSSRIAGNVQMDLTLKGCGFKNPAQVTLISSGGAEYAASDISVVSSTQIAATFAPNSVPAGTYSVRVSTGATAQDTLSGVLEVISHGTPKLEASLAAPNPIRYRQATNATVDYGNTGNAAMPAPLLVVSAYQNGKQGALLTLDSSIAGQGFWTSAIPKGFSHSVQMLGCGNMPGLLQPGEWQRFQAYYAGWEEPWDLSYPDAQFVLGKLTEDNTEPIDWSSLKAEMRPSRLSDEAWDALWANFTTGVGSKWGDYVAMLNNNARYLGRIGLDVRDISELLRFEFLQANGLSPIRNLASSMDAAVDVPGVPLGFSRFYPQSITKRHTLGAFGYGWTHSWDMRLETAADGTITILGPGSAQRTFQPDVRGGWFADKGDYGILRAIGGGSYTLQEKGGVLTAFRSDGKLDYVVDTNGNRVTATYTGALLTRLTHSTGPWLQVDYNASDLVSQITDSVGRITGYTYDAPGTHLQSVQAPDGGVVAYQYLPAGNVQSGHALTEIAYPGGSHRYFTYDAAGRLGSSARDDDKEHVSFAYDTAGRVTATDALGASTRFYFDHLGRLARTEDPLGRLVDFEFDINHNLTALIGPEGHTYDYAYDSTGNLTKMTDPLRDETKFTYTNPYKRLNLLTDANGHSTRHESDTAGNLAGIVMSDGSYEKWSYNSQGLPTVWRNRRGQQVKLDWDTNGRLIRKTYPDGTKSEYSYDTRGNLLSAANPSGTTGYTYNSRDELTQVAYPGGKWLRFTYDDAGRRSTSLDQLGHKLIYAYDAAGRLERMTDENNAAVVEYVYDNAGRVSRKTLGNGTYTTNTYDLAGQLLELTNHAADASVLSFFHYTYDGRGRRATMETHYGTWTYGYDDVGQLTLAVLVSTDSAIPSQDLTYTYDALGNRLRTVENGVTKTYTVNALNQYTQVGDTAYEFDADGNLVRETSPSGTTVYTYNFENRLIAVTKGGKTWQYAYDGLGNRIAVTEDGVTTKYVVDPAGLGNVVGEYDASGNLAAHYDHDFGLLSRTDGSGNQATYTFDAIGNVQQMVTSGGTVANEYAYAPFGTELLKDETVANPFQFIGQLGVMHEENGSEFMRARFYSSTIGRFESQDPLGILSGDINAYTYCNNDCLSCFDPVGLSAFSGDFLNSTIAPELWDRFFDWLRFQYYKHGYGLAGGGNVIGRILGGKGFPRVPLGPWTNAYAIYQAGKLGWDIGTKIEPEVNKGMEDIFYFMFTGHLPPDVPTTVIDKKDVRSAGSMDPNEKTGPAVYGPQAFVSVNAVLPYRIDFENDRTATAPAQTVFVTDQLSANFEWGSFMLTEIGFGDNRIEIPAGRQQYETVIPMSYGGADFEVQVQAGLDPATGLLTVRFMSIDPTTGLPPANSNAGFLPPEDGTGRGMGFVKYTVMAKSGLPTGTELRNIANITFDFIETIATNQVDPHDPSQGTDPNLECLSRIDAVAPSTSVAVLPATSRPIFTVSWDGTDDAGGAGLRDYTVLVSTDGGPYVPWLTNTTDTSAIFVGRPSHSYAFHSIGHDHVGNTEAAPTAADTTVATLPHSFDEWRLARFTTAELTNPAIGGEAADPDGDGYPNLLEFALWLDPQSGSMGGLPQAGTADGYLTLTYQTPADPSSYGITYEVQAADDLAGPWSSAGVAPLDSAEHGDYRSITTRDAVPMAGHPHRFMRVKVNLP